MLLTFPDLDALRLAITSQVVPDAVCRSAAQVEFVPDGRVTLATDAAISKTAETALKRLGVILHKGTSAGEPLLCWPQALPLVRDEQAEVSEKLPVLFELSDDAHLAEVVSEMLRLGNDRQAFRWLGDGSHCKALLKVIGPPYYTLLRALGSSPPTHDPTGSNTLPLNAAPAAPRAYVERGERVWIEFGWNHPLAGKLKPPAGKLLLMRPPHHWLVFEEGRFQDVYAAIDFLLPAAVSTWQPSEQVQRISVPLKLTASDSADPAELWVLSGTGVEQLDDLVKNGDDLLLSRLSFAVAQHENDSIILVRARPGKTAPPVLVLDGLAYRPYLKLPNLFVPCTARLHPPLRRDAVKQLLAEDSRQIVWLQPAAGGMFVPHSLPDEAFRPLPDWIDYVLDREHAALTAWREAMRFDFEPFVCHETSTDKPKPDRPKRTDDELIDEPLDGSKASDPPTPRKLPTKKAKDAAAPATDAATASATKAQPNELRLKLREFEQQIQQLESPLNAQSEHLAVWGWMTQLNAALGRDNDAAVCAGNALWDGESNPQVPGFWTWHRQRPDVSPETEWDSHRLDELLTDPAPPLTAVGGLAAFLAWTCFAPKSPPQLSERLAKVQQFLEGHESLLGVRLAWVAWLGIFKASQNDVLTLARARDRLLERLFQQGLSPDLDLPGFLRFSGLPQSDRIRSAREHVLQLREVVSKWLAANKSGPGSFTAAYSELMFAFALARLGEKRESKKLEDRAAATLKRTDVVHRWLSDAFAHRIEQALDGRASGPFPDELLAELEGLDRTNRYVIDRLRERSRILEPHEKFDPYRNWKRADELSSELATLCDVTDRAVLQTRLYALLRGKLASVPEEVRVVATALDLSPRLGEAFAGDVLDRVRVLLDKRPALAEQMHLLEKGLFVAAHFDQSAYVQDFVSRFRQVIETDASPEFEKALEGVLEKSFHGLRKLGMRDEIARLLELIDARVRTSPPKAGAPDQTLTSRLKALLHIAAAWFYFSRDDKALTILDEVRTTLLEGNLSSVFQTELSSVYANALGQSPIELSVSRLAELFGGLERISDTYTTGSHYSRSQLGVVEAAVRALVSDDFNIDKAARRWLDDDEFLVRRKIHADVRELLTAPPA